MTPVRSKLARAGLVATVLLGACSSSDSASSETTTAAVAAETTAAIAADTTAASTADTTAAEADTTVATDAAETTAAAAAATDGTDTTPAIVAATEAFLATLSADEQAAVQFDFTDTAQRQRWSNLPEGLFSRDGLMWGDMSTETQDAWLAVMQATLSAEGYERIRGEWAADEALAAEGSGGGLTFGEDYYWVAVIGTPSETEPWQWQWGGHHVTVNATIVGTEVALTPSFIGVQPATFTASGEEIRPLGDIETDAFALVGSLDADQQSTAVLGDTLIDLVLGPGEDGRTIESEGLAGSAMTDDQRAAFLTLIGDYGNLVNAEDGASRMADLESELDDTYFAWYGPTTSGSGIYFRVTGPSIVIEFSGQSMGGDPAEHVHGIYRDPTNDYGAELGAGI